MTNLLAVTVAGFVMTQIHTNIIESRYDPILMKEETARVATRALPPIPLSPSTTEKWVTTEITQTDKLQFVWLNEIRVVETSKVLTNWTVHLTQEWKSK